MASKRVVKSTVNWVEMAQRCPESQKKNFLAFKSKSDGYLRKVAACPEEAPKIDWAYYKANAANKAIVEQLEKQYNSIKFPYPDDQGAYSKLDSEREVYTKQLAVFVKNSNERIKKYEEELEAIRNAPSYDEVTEEEYAYMHPNLALDPLNRPTTFPHLPELQLTKEDRDFYRSRNIMYKKPDKYFPEG